MVYGRRRKADVPALACRYLGSVLPVVPVSQISLDVKVNGTTLTVLNIPMEIGLSSRAIV